MFFKAAENHILCLERTARGDVVAGSGGNGLVYRITTEGRASVLFETPYEEVRTLAVDREGQIYAAASGTPTRTRKDETSDEPVRIDTDVVLTVRPPAARVVQPPPRRLPLRPGPRPRTGGRSTASPETAWPSASGAPTTR